MESKNDKEEITAKELLAVISVTTAGVLLLIFFCYFILWPVNVWFHDNFPWLTLKGWHPC